MYRQQRLIALILFAVLSLTLAVLPVQPAAAQNGLGINNVTFWDDASQSLVDNVAAPAAAASAGFHYLNAAGGRTEDDGLFVIVGDGRYNVVRDRDWQVFNRGNDGRDGSMKWMVALDHSGSLVCFPSSASEFHSCDASDGAHGINKAAWDSVTLSDESDTSVTMTMVGSLENATITLTTVTTYDSTNPYVFTVQANLTASGSSANQISDVNLYLGADLYLDGYDNGPGVVDEFWGETIAVQTNGNNTAVGGFRDDGTPWTSYLVYEYECVFGDTEVYPGFNCPDTVGERGPSANEGYSNELGTGQYDDIGAGVHWAIGTLPSATITTEVFFASRDVFDNPPPAPATPTPAAPTVTPATCPLPPTLELKPDPLAISPGGAATVWVELVNQCRDLPTAAADALLSFADGLTVIETSQGVLNLGQRAALQRFTLGAGETFGWYAIVRAADPFITAPKAIGEIYSGAAVVRTDELNFTTAAVPMATAAAPAAAAPAPLPAAAPLPVALPNTSGGWDGLTLSAMVLSTLLALSGLLLIGRRRSS